MDSSFNGSFNISSWSATKFIETSNVAIDGATDVSYLSQQLSFVQKRISIGWISIYMGATKSNPSLDFVIHMDVRSSNSDKTPGDTILGSATLTSSLITVDGWYKFEFDISEMDTPANGLSIVMWQTGGNNDNYASWAYNVGSYDGSFVSTDGTTWDSQSGIHRVLRSAANFDAYSAIINSDPSKITHELKTPPAIQATGTQDTVDELSDGTFVNTVLDTSTPSYPYYPAQPTPIVRLDSKNLHVSIVSDSSGSSGWNDRFGMRKRISTKLVERLKESYPKEVTFDVIHYGGRPLEVLPVSLNQRVRGVFVSVDSFNLISGYDADGNSLSQTDVRGHLGTGIVSYGFKNLKTETTYVSFGFDLGWSNQQHRAVAEQWHSMWPTDSPSLTSSTNGPNDQSALNILLSDSTKNSIRYQFGGGSSAYRDSLSSDFLVGTDVANVANPASVEVNQLLSVVDKSGIRPGWSVASTDTDADTITFKNNVYRTYTPDAGGFVETYYPEQLASDWDQTDGFEFFFLDAAQKGEVTFYVQTANGAHIEWDFTPLSSWELINLYYLDETATFDINAVDANGDPLPDGTTVEFYVDREPTDELEQEAEDAQKSFPLTADADSGTTILYISSENAQNITRGDTLDVIDDDRNPEKLADGGEKNYHTSTVSSIDKDSGKVVITDALPAAYNTSTNAGILTPSTDTEGGFDVNLVEKLPITANLVDITPVYNGSSLPSELYNDLDAPPASPSAAEDDYNTDPTRVVRSVIEVMTKDGYGAVRLCPITEDRFLPKSVRDALASSMFNLSERDQVRAQALLDMEKGEMKDGTDDTVLVSTTGATETSTDEEESYYDGVPDFVMDHKVVTFGGAASSDMRSFSTELEEVTVGEADPREYLARTYSIYPVMTLFDSDGDKIALVLMQDFQVYFASPIYIGNTIDRTVTYRQCPVVGGEPGETTETEVPGAYATDEGLVTVSYEVTDKDFPVDGTLTVNIYDARRTIQTRNATDDDLGELNGCGDTVSMSGGEKIFSTSSDDTYTASLTDKLLADDILGEDYPSSFTIEVVGGVASFTLPKIDRVSLLEIHAIFEFDNGAKKFVNKQNVYYKNPVVILLTGLGKFAADGESKFNLGASVSWKELYPVNDGTIVNFEGGGSPMAPSTSQTITGLADGVLIGPHEPIPAPTGLAALSDSDGSIPEGITAITSYQGYTSSKSGDIFWTPESPEGEDFYFYATGSNTNPDSEYNGTKKMWSDGYDYVVINGDLPASSFRAFPFIDSVYEELVQDRMGVVYSAGGLTVETRLPRWSETPPSEGPYENDGDVPYGWVTNRLYSNQFIGRPPYREPNPDNPDPCESPDCVSVSLFTKSRRQNIVGIGIDSDTVSFLSSTIGGGAADIPKPRAYPVEPLGITMSMEPVDRTEYQSVEWRKTPLGQSPKSAGYDSYNNPIIRNGENKYFTCAEITWKDKFVIGTSGNPLPKVQFEVGTAEIDSKTGDVTFTPLANPSDCPIDSPDADIKHVRTTFDYDHYHEVYVDDNGQGYTTSTITYVNGGAVSDHVHKINIYDDLVVKNSLSIDEDGNQVNHSHSMRSIAVVGVGPVINKTLSIAIKGEVTYDNGKVKSDGTRVGRTLDNYTFTYPESASTIGTIESGYKLEIIPVGKQFVEGKVVNAFSTRNSGTESGYTILFKASIIMPDGGETPVEDGTRVFANFDFYEFEEEDADNSDDDLLIVGKNDEPKNVAVLKIGAFLPQFSNEVRADQEVMITSNIHWFPSVSADPNIRKPETDTADIAAAINSYAEIGSSQINDAIALAARRMITFEEHIGSSKKIIVVLSDCSESYSELSFDQAIDEVTAVDRQDTVEIFAIKLSDTMLYDDLVAQKFAIDTDGEVLKVAQVAADPDDTADEVVEGIVESPNFDVVTGTYTNTVDLGDNKLFDRLKFNILIPDDSSLIFRVRFSEDGMTYGSWITLGEGDDFTLSSSASTGRYLQYEMTFRGNPETFESPEFYGVTYDYYEPRGYTLFFQPIPVEDGKDGYVGEIIFTHHGTIPSTSVVEYGITHDESNDKDDFYSVDQPLLEAGHGGIILSRVNELLIRSDSQSFKAAYGGWNQSYDVELYRVSDEFPLGTLVSSSSYSVEYASGLFSFGQSQPSSDTFTMTLGLKPFFKIMVNMVNYGPDALSLDYVGSMYRTVDRSDIYADGHKPIYTVVDTDLDQLGVTSSGIVSASQYVYNTEIGNDSDKIKDIILVDGIYYVLAWNGSNAYVSTLSSNLTFIERVVTPLSIEPLSIGIMDGIWHISYTYGRLNKVVRMDSDWNIINTLEMSFTDSNSGVIRSRLDRWYSPSRSRIDIYSRSFELRSDNIEPDAEITGVLDVIDNNLYSISRLRDIIFEFAFDGTITKTYTLSERATSVINVRYVNNAIMLVESNRIYTVPL